MTLNLRKRKRLKKKEVQGLLNQLSSACGLDLDWSQAAVDRAQGPNFDVVFVDNEALVMVHQDVTFPTVRGLLKYDLEKRYVTVDMGAIPYVMNGADIMAPGIVDADADISEGELVWVRDETHGRPLAIGLATRSSTAMLESKGGRAVKVLHHVGDELWEY